MHANREGLFHAYPVEIGLGETQQNKLLQAVVVYRLFEELVQGSWVDVSAEGMEITGYHCLEKRDHSLNEMTIDALKAALGWDGRDPFWLEDNAETLAEKAVQVKLGLEEYNGSTHLKVQFLNPYGSRGTGGVPRADAEMRRSVTNRLGPKFRALAGGTPISTPTPAGSPAAPKPPTPQAPTATAAPPAGCTMDEAWAAFCHAYAQLGPKGSDDDREKQWFTIVAELAPGKQPDELSPAEWAIVRDEGPNKIIPF